MGINKDSMGLGAVGKGLLIRKAKDTDKVVALGGNPNVGKSTVFNELTGLRQHTGNWPGKTVANAQGRCEFGQKGYVLVDLPGCYSLMAQSAEEEAARDFLCFGGADAAVIVCDATCLERNLNLALQTIEITPHVVVCVNLMDEARKKRISIDLEAISQKLGVPVVGTAARGKDGLDALMQAVEAVAERREKRPIQIAYPDYIESAIAALEPVVSEAAPAGLSARWLSLMLLQGGGFVEQQLSGPLGERAAPVLEAIRADFARRGITARQIGDAIVSALVTTAEEICQNTVVFHDKDYRNKDARIDRVLTGKWTAFPIMLLALLGVFWLTITGANYPSQILSQALFWLEGQLLELLAWMPLALRELLVLGVYRVLAWVVSVMLPPMAIFFPLFTLLEDVGFLPRVAFNLDSSFKKCCACGKQALTMCMGFGCNAAGVIGCRIIDSPRERLIAILTNSFVPCNGRFPTLIAIIAMFFTGAAVGAGAGVELLSAVLLTCAIVLGVAMTFVASKLLSKTLLKGLPSSFTLELPPYRRPQIGRVIVRSVLDRTLFVLGRAVCVAAPAGLVIWLMANVSVGGATLLAACAGFLDPLGRLMGMDGVILLAFILGFPANEVVLPIIVMAYTAQGAIMDIGSLPALRQLLLDNGWTWVTALSVMLFSLMHWPCSTTCLTIKKETQSLKWTALAILLPTAMGMAACMLLSGAARILGAP